MKFPFILFLTLFFSNAIFTQTDTATIEEKPKERDHWQILLDSAQNLVYKADFEAALVWADSALKVAERDFGPDHAYLVHSLDMKSYLYIELGWYAKAEPVVLRTAREAARLFGKKDVSYGMSMESLSRIYYYLGRLEEALVSALQAVEILTEAKGPDHEFLGGGLNMTATIYQEMGEYQKALPYMLRALDNREKNYGKEHIFYAIMLNNIGDLYGSMNDYGKTIKMYEQALEIVSNSVGKNHRYYGTMLHNLAVVYSKTGNLAKATPMFMEHIENTVNTLGKDNNRYGTGLNGLALHYKRMGRYEKSLSTFQQALESRAAKLGKDHYGYHFILNNMAGVYLLNDQPERALPLYEKVLQNFKKTLGTEHLHYAQVLTHLVKTCRYLDKEEKGNSYLEALYENLAWQVNERFPFLNDRLQAALMQKLDEQVAQIQSFAMTFPSARTQTMAVNSQLLLKGLLQSNARSLLSNVRQNLDTTLQASLEEWEITHRRLAREYLLPVVRRSVVFDSLKNRAQHLELELAAASVDFASNRSIPDWQAVRQAIPPRSAAIEFSAFKHIQKDTLQVYYAAHIIHKDWSSPKSIFLFPESELDSLFSKGARMGEPQINNLYAVRSLTPIRKKKLNEGLGTLLWAPFDSILGAAKKIYYSPAGLLHRLNLEAINYKKNQLLSEHYKLIRLVSLRSLLNKENQTNESPESRCYLFGGLDYDRTEEPSLNNWREEKVSGSTQSEQGELGSVRPANRSGVSNWLPLANTEKEVVEIARQMEAAGMKVELLAGVEGTEERIKNLPVRPRILHFATHGYFFPDPKKTAGELPGISKLPSMQLAEHPMVRSGLVLAGANQSASGTPFPVDREDGLLTAYEVSRLDLSGTELVVLSACDTGLGEVRGNEGVYGLQRAFKIAGAKYILMSLWQVPDEETAQLMTSFYRHWLTGKTVREALLQAQRTMREKYPPYYWAGFVLME